jgi:hypothetical protein
MLTKVPPSLIMGAGTSVRQARSSFATTSFEQVDHTVSPVRQGIDE